jgi:Fe-S oxidoreductase
MGVRADEVAQSTVSVLNALGIRPQVMADERCCGHDLLWEGDVEGFAALAELNAELIHESGAKRIVTSCPECARALSVDYPAHGVDLGVEILHLAELVAQEAPEADGGNGQPNRSLLADAMPSAMVSDAAPRATYHDPCRLGRHLGVYDQPRQAIAEAGFELVEMPRHRENAQCCGTNGWTHCGAANKQIQSERLREAQATGAEVLVAACLKCQIHFLCALQDRQLDREITIEIRDLSTLLAQALQGNGASRTQGA